MLSLIFPISEMVEFLNWRRWSAKVENGESLENENEGNLENLALVRMEPYTDA